MKKFTLIILIVAIAMIFIACDKPQEEQPKEEQPTFEQRMIEDVCKDMGWDTQGVTLTLVYSEYVPWQNCVCYTYILTLPDGSRWLAGARENEDGFYADVECEIV